MTMKIMIDGVERDMSEEQIAELRAAQSSAFVKTVVTSVSARQFKLQLLAAGLIDAVDAWVAQQDRATRISYEYSGSFVKSSPMMQAGFAAMGFTSEQVDEFFTAASAL